MIHDPGFVRSSLLAVGLLCLNLWQAQSVLAQDRDVSPGKAFLLSAAVPGAGHAYVQQGSWRGSATVYAGADVALWTGLVATILRRDHLIESYSSLASSRAGAMIDGKNRTFFLYVGSYVSSDDFRDAMLRNRQWELIDYAADRSYQWNWTTDADFQRYRSLREDSESLNRRTSFLVALLAGNRVMSAVTAARYASRTNRAVDLNINLGLHPDADLPLVAVRLNF
jgi:hypothetical protein